MSAVVKLASKLPGDFETNGLDSQVQDLIARPKDLLVAVVWLDVAKITDDVDTGEQVPTVRVRRIEPLGEAGDVSQAVRDIVAEAAENRLGRKAIPFEIAEVVQAQATIEDEL